MKTKNILAAIGLLLSTATFSQVGIGTTTPDASSVLDLESTTKGFLPPRMSTAQRNAIATPATGLTIFNTSVNCLQWWNGTGWYNVCDGDVELQLLGGSFTNGFQNNNSCAAKVISVTPCSAVAGASVNDITGTADGIEYDWTGATGNMSGGTTQALVEIGGQCWFRRNSIKAPTAPCGDAINTGCNVWLATSPGDIGSWGYYNTTTVDGTAGWGTTEPAVGEGLLYQWSAAMNGSTTERAQGVCPTGWHVPSDCEWMFLEGSLGMSTADQQASNTWRNSGSVGSKLSTFTSSSVNNPGTGTNSSGFTALLAGYRWHFGGQGAFLDNGNFGIWWSSSELSTSASRRDLFSIYVGVFRRVTNKAEGFSVRCLKN